MSPPREDIVILDFGIHRGGGAGHNLDYLTALREALPQHRLESVAPAGRSRRLQEFLVFWRLAARDTDGARVVINENPKLADFVFYWLASGIRRRRRLVGIFVLRRTESAAELNTRYGRLKAVLRAWVVQHLIRARRLHAASDSRLVLEFWRRRSGVEAGTHLAIPVPQPPANALPVTKGRPVVGLLGRFHAEKGAARYDGVIRAVLETFEEGELLLQLPDPAGDPLEPLVNSLIATWRDHPRVQIFSGHLPRELYAALLAASDIVVLPYLVEFYGTGTSGVFHDALACGAKVVATRIAWAADEFADHPDVVWLDGADSRTLANGLWRAYGSAALGRARMLTDDDAFTRTWRAAVEAAVESAG